MPFIALDPEAAEAAPTTTIGQPKTGWGKSLADMEAELAFMLGGRTDVPSDQYRVWINDAYLDVTTSLKLDEQKGSFELLLVAGQPLYLLPPVVHSIQDIALTDPLSIHGGEPLGKTDRSAYRGLEDLEGGPKMYFRDGDMLVLYPTPDKTYSITVDFRVRPALLVEDTDCPVLGPEWHRAILLRARANAFDDLREFANAAPAENSAVNTVRRRTDREAAEDEGRVIGSSVPGRRSQYRGIRRVR
jgi:hypothetical protein